MKLKLKLKQYRRGLHCISSSIFAIGPVNNSPLAHLCFHTSKQLYRLLSVLQSMEGPLLINEVVAAILVCSINCVVHSSTFTSVVS